MIKQPAAPILVISLLLSVAVFVISRNINRQQPLGYRTFEGINGWGYDILVNDTVVIHQEYIPVISGRRGFPRSAQAQETARLVIRKIQDGYAPTLTRSELNSIYVVKD